MNNSIKYMLGSLILAASAVLPAHAHLPPQQVYNWTFTGEQATAGVIFSGSGTFTNDTTATTDTLPARSDGFEGYLITGASGIIDGQAVTGVISQNNSYDQNNNLLGDGAANNGSITSSGDGAAVLFDTTLYRNGKANGVSIATAADSLYGFSFLSLPNSPSYNYPYAVVGYDQSGSYIGFVQGYLTVAPAPEPATLALAAFGGLTGLMAYRRRK